MDTFCYSMRCDNSVESCFDLAGIMDKDLTKLFYFWTYIKMNFENKVNIIMTLLFMLFS